MKDSAKTPASTKQADAVIATVTGKRYVKPSEIKDALGAKTYGAVFAATSAAYHAYGAGCLIATTAKTDDGQRYWAYSDPALATKEEVAKHAKRMAGLQRTTKKPATKPVAKQRPAQKRTTKRRPAKQTKTAVAA